MTYDPEIEKLLPWYAKGLLDADEAAQVDAYLSENPEMRMQLDLIAEENLAIEQQHAALGAPSAGGLDRLMADIDALETEKAPIKSAATGFFAKLKETLDGFASPGLQFAAMAAALVVVAQGVIIGGLLQGEPASAISKPTYTTASGPEQQAAVEGHVFLVAFAKDARMDDVAKLLKSLSAKIISGPKGGGFFELQVSTDALPPEGADGVLKQLKATGGLVKFASVSQ